MTLTELFTNIATAIRNKTGGTDKLKPTEFATQINNIVTKKDLVVLTNQRRFYTTGSLSAGWSGSYDIAITASAKCNFEQGSTVSIWAKKSDGTTVTLASKWQKDGILTVNGTCTDCVEAGVNVTWPTSDGTYSNTSLCVTGTKN